MVKFLFIGSSKIFIHWFKEFPAKLIGLDSWNCTHVPKHHTHHTHTHRFHAGMAYGLMTALLNTGTAVFPMLTAYIYGWVWRVAFFRENMCVCFF